jgi:hypothetical protein
MTRGHGTRSLVCVIVLVCIAAGAQAQSAGARSADALPNPRLFRIAAAQLPWHADFLLDARVERNSLAKVDGAIIYETAPGGASWSSLHRVTGWYEDALMKRGNMTGVAEILVSEFKSTSAATTAHVAEVANIGSLRKLTSRPKLGSESAEFVSSNVLKEKTKTLRVEGSTIYTRDQNLELDVAVFDSHAPKDHWLQQYRQVASTIAVRLVSLAKKALGQGRKPSPTLPRP